MKWKALLWTIVLSVLIFFILVYLGMKFQWVHALQDKKTIENEKVTLVIPKNSVKNPANPPSLAVEMIKPVLIGEKQPQSKKNGNKKETAKKVVSPSLVGEETQLIDFTGMPLEMVVEECRRISKKVGVPAKRFNQSVNECTTRNFQGRTSDNPARSRNLQAKFRKQCKDSIPAEQQALFSPEEMKLLIDECVVDLRTAKQ